MSNYFDDDDAFWDGPVSEAERTSQIERVQRRSVDRTRTHHVVQRDERLDALDDGSSMWIEPASPVAGRLGPLSSVDPRVLSVGAVVLAIVVAVPLFGALGDEGGNGDDLRAIDAQSTTTVVTTAPPSTAAEVVVVTAAVDGVQTGDSDDASDVDVSDESSSAEDPSSAEDSSSAEAAPSEEASDEPAPSDTAPALPTSPDCANQYTAEAGDYWMRIADGSGTSLDSLLDVNEATAETPIYPGSTICLPEGAAAPAAFASLRNSDASGGGVEAPEPQPCANRYESVAGDYWLRIAGAAGLELDELLELNDATADTPLYPGSEVCLPAGTSGPAAPTTAAPTTAAPATAAPATAAPATTQPATTDAPATTQPATTAPPATTAAPETTVAPAPPAPGDIEQIIRDAWPDELEEQALRIAWRESNYNPRAQNYCCSGLFQIYYEVHAGWLADLGVNSVEDLYDPRTNAAAAYTLYQRSGSWEPWRMTAD